MNESLVNTTKKSKKYDDFSFINGNRGVKESHVRRLVEAIKESGNFTEVSPVLVNDKHQIIDGQHRVLACKELGLPFYYITVPGIGINEARDLNVFRLTWTAMDFAESYAGQGQQAYKDYIELYETYGLPHSIILQFIYGGFVRNMNGTFRKGGLEIADLEMTKARLDHLQDVLEHAVLPKYHFRSFAFALLNCMKVEGYDMDRMEKKIAQHPTYIKSTPILADNQRQLEDLYNKNQGATTRLRLF